MAAVWNDESKLEMLTAILGSTRFSTGKMLLFTTLSTVDDNDSYGTISSNELSVTGYARQDLTGWTSPALVGHRATAYADLVTFSNSSGSPSGSVTGWAFVDNANSKIIEAGIFPAPFSIAAGDVYRTVPVVTFKGELDSM